MQSFSNQNSNHHLTWHEADKSWLKAKGRAVRSMVDSSYHEPGVGRYVVAGIATIAIASTVGFSGVVSGDGLGSNALLSGIEGGAPLGFIVEPLAGGPQSIAAQVPGECGPLAVDAEADASGGADAGASADVGNTGLGPAPIVGILPPIGPDDLPLDAPESATGGNIPPDDDDTATDEETATDADSASDDDSSDGSSDSDDNSSGAEFGDDLIGAGADLFGDDAVDLGILDGGLLDIGIDSLDPGGTGTGTNAEAMFNGSGAIGGEVDPQEDDVIDVEVDDQEITDEVESVAPEIDQLDGSLETDLLGDDLLGGIAGDLGGLLN